MSARSDSLIHNPFDHVLENANNNSTQLQAAYVAQRATRNAQQAARILAPDFPGWSLDPVLRNLESAEQEPEDIDTRYCACVWARPPCALKDLIQTIQREVCNVAPNLWYVPRDNLHMTVLEVCSSLTEPEVEDIIAPLQSAIFNIVNHSYTHRTRLVKPLINCDLSGLAISFVPAAGEALDNSLSHTTTEGQYTYHHLRRDVYQKAAETGTEIKSRYVIPSAHITIARFVTNDGFLDGISLPGDNGERRGSPSPNTELIHALMKKIEQLNAWLELEHWTQDDAVGVKKAGVWNVGEEIGLVFVKGRAWYGKGTEVLTGQPY